MAIFNSFLFVYQRVHVFWNLKASSLKQASILLGFVDDHPGFLVHRDVWHRDVVYESQFEREMFHNSMMRRLIVYYIYIHYIYMIYIYSIYSLELWNTDDTHVTQLGKLTIRCGKSQSKNCYNSSISMDHVPHPCQLHISLNPLIIHKLA